MKPPSVANECAILAAKVFERMGLDLMGIVEILGSTSQNVFRHLNRATKAATTTILIILTAPYLLQLLSAMILGITGPTILTTIIVISSINIIHM